MSLLPLREDSCPQINISDRKHHSLEANSPELSPPSKPMSDKLQFVVQDWWSFKLNRSLSVGESNNPLYLETRIELESVFVRVDLYDFVHGS